MAELEVIIKVLFIFGFVFLLWVSQSSSMNYYETNIRIISLPKNEAIYGICFNFNLNQIAYWTLWASA